MALTYNDMDAVVQKAFLPGIVNQVFTVTPLLTRLMAKNKVTLGGGDIAQRLEYEELNGGSYDGLDKFNTDYVETETVAVWQWKHVYINVTIPGTKLRKAQAAGSEKVGDLLADKLANAQKSLNKKLSEQLAGDGTGNANKDLDGLYNAIDDGVIYDSYAGISRATNAWWKAYVDSTAHVLTASFLQEAIGACTDGKEKPDLILMRQALFNKLWDKIYAKQFYPTTAQQDIINAGFQAINFNGTTVTVDNTITPADSIYGLNTDYFKLTILKTGAFIWTNPKEPTNQSAYIRQLLLDANLICTKPIRCFRLDSIS
ncbi:MAG: phage major capsid protein [Candidatus Paceibacterota bacterium]